MRNNVQFLVSKRIGISAELWSEFPVRVQPKLEAESLPFPLYACSAALLLTSANHLYHRPGFITAAGPSTSGLGEVLGELLGNMNCSLISIPGPGKREILQPCHSLRLPTDMKKTKDMLRSMNTARLSLDVKRIPYQTNVECQKEQFRQPSTIDNLQVVEQCQYGSPLFLQFATNIGTIHLLAHFCGS